MTEPVFTVGQRVRATGRYMHQLTEGKEYVVTEYSPKEYGPTFTWEACVTVLGDFGTPVSGHWYRFRPIETEEGATS